MSSSPKVSLPRAAARPNSAGADLAQAGARQTSLRRSLLVATCVTAVWLAVRLCYAVLQPYPIPSFHDEFGYLLEADTFAHGRLANPPHPYPEFFESPHVLVRPTYASKYPPAAPMFLALGQVVFGSPYWGVIIESAAMMFAFTLMLTAWISFPWAIVVMLPIGIYMQPTMHWTYSYWGGAVAAAGAALVLFATGRHIESRRALYGMPLGVGWVLLFWTRPYEGGVFSIVAIAIWVWRLRSEGEWLRPAISACACALPLLIAAGIWTAAYNKAVTGSALEMPYLLHQETYMTQPVFWFQQLRPQPHLDNPRLIALHGTNGTEAQTWRDDQGLRNKLVHAKDVLKYMFAAIGPVMLFIVFVPLVWNSWRVRAFTVLTGAGFVALYLLTFEFSHYAAPFAASVALLAGCVAEAMGSRSSKTYGRTAIVCCSIASCLVAVAIRLRDRPGSPDEFPKTRQAVIQRLSHLPGPQLVFVRYPHPEMGVVSEWVFNSADIDAQKIVFAFDFGRKEDQKLLNYYPNRQAWLVTVDGKEYSVSPMSRTEGQG